VVPPRPAGTGASVAATEETGRRRRRRAPLTSRELAEAAVLADVTVALCLLGFFLPLGTIFIMMAVTPMAAVGARHRPRAVLAAGVAAAVASLLIGGTGLAGNVVGCAVLGSLTGTAVRRGWSRRRTLLVAGSVVWPPLAAVAVGTLFVLGNLRRLALDQVTNSWRGTTRLLQQAGIGAVAKPGDPVVTWLVTHWPITIGASLLGVLLTATWVAYTLSRPVLAVLAASGPAGGNGAGPTGDLAEPGADRVRESGPPDPVPVSLRHVRFHYPGAPRDALRDVSMDIGAGEFVAVVGENGSGKSTLARILAGRPPSAGTVRRPGPVGLGQPGGTAMIFQRPETQVLGVRVRDDIVWGLPPDEVVDVAGLLDVVGLGGFAERETSALSGGELQRLALAACLARRPRLLLSDETTAMIDPDGRRQVVSLLGDVAAAGTTVCHVTHRPEETAGADRLFTLAGGEVVAGALAGMAGGAALGGLGATAGPGGRKAPVGPPTPSGFGHVGALTLEGVGHVYGRGSPWAHRALRGVDLAIGGGEGILIVGRNGSGKSTLAWVLAGLLVPSEGDALLDGQPVDQCVGRVGLAFQHARLQLLRPTAGSDIRAASGCDAHAADAALRLVGLDPAEFASRPVDRMSGGQQRRVALAGLLASGPRLLVLDEPFAGLDQRGRTDLIAVLARLRAQTGATIVIVSHDTEGSDRVVDRLIHLDGGRVVSDTSAAGGPSTGRLSTGTSEGGGSGAAAAPDGLVAGREGSGAPPARRAGRRARGGKELRLLQVLPRDTPMHRLWAGTKLLALLAVAGVLSVRPAWSSIAVMGAVVALGLLVARVPRGAVPHLPRWFWFAVLVGALLALEAGGPPRITVAGHAIGVGALDEWVRFTVLAFIVLIAAALVSWTTPLAGVAPALRRLGAPLARVGLPVEEWAVAVALGIRCMPLLIDEVRTLVAVRRLRSPHRGGGRQDWRLRIGEPLSLLASALVVGVRRAGELADAVDARGGLGRFADDDRSLRLADVIVLVLVAGGAAAALLI